MLLQIINHDVEYRTSMLEQNSLILCKIFLLTRGKRQNKWNALTFFNMKTFAQARYIFAIKILSHSAIVLLSMIFYLYMCGICKFIESF